ncbi:MAG: BON domain-containing protein [Burkholderiaceae bacterium]
MAANQDQTPGESAAPAGRRLLARTAMIMTLVVASLIQTACFTLAATGVALGALAAIDRRSIGAQTEDQTIELKARSLLRERLSDASGIAATSFNRRVLLTGQVLSDQDKQLAGATVAGLPNVRGVYNELEISGQPSLQVTASDVTITTRVKTSLLRDQLVPGNSVKVKTESGSVYLMGLVTNEEAERAASIASRSGGVQKVVTVFEIISTEEAASLSTDAARKEASGNRPASGSQPRQ